MYPDTCTSKYTYRYFQVAVQLAVPAGCYSSCRSKFSIEVVMVTREFRSINNKLEFCSMIIVTV